MIKNYETAGGRNSVQVNEETDLSSDDGLLEPGKYNVMFEDEDANVEVEVATFSPEIGEGPNDSVVIFFPGWGMTAKAKSPRKLTHGFQNELAKDSGSTVFSVDTRADKIMSDSLDLEALAVSRLVEQSGLRDKKLILAGHSQGGQEAIWLASQLLMEKDLQVAGLILLDPTGLYDQKSSSLVTRFIGNSVKSFVHHPSKEVLQAGKDITKGVGGEMKRSGLDYQKRLRNEINDMSNRERIIQFIDCPVVLIQGKMDSVSDPSLTRQEAKRVSEIMDDKLEDDTDAHQVLAKLFPHSPYVRWIIGERLGHHDMPLYRGEQVAKVALYLLRRYNREQSA